MQPSALLLHGAGVTEVPSSSSLRRYNPISANSLMYWHLLERAIRQRTHGADRAPAIHDSNTLTGEHLAQAIRGSAVVRVSLTARGAIHADRPLDGTLGSWTHESQDSS